MARKKISYSDYALLRLNDPENLMVITGLMTFDTPLEYQQLKATLEKSLLRFKRFRQRITKPYLPFIRPSWEDDPNFNFDSHLVQVELPFPADQNTLQDLISSLMSAELDYSRPLWEFYFVENYGTGSALIARLHHSLADGIALIQVLLSMTDTHSNPSGSEGAQDLARDDLQSPKAQVSTVQAGVLDSDNWIRKILRNAGKQIILDPSHALYRARQIVDHVSTAGRLVLRWPDPQTVFKGPLGIEKRAVWTAPIDLKDVKYIGKEFHCTVNDVLFTAVAGALRQYIDSRGGAAKDLNIRGFIPVNLRPIELDEELGNKFGPVLLSLPVGIDDPIERLRRVRQNMDQLKSSSEPIVGFGIVTLLGVVPSWVEGIVANFMDTKGTAVITNVPGSQTKLYLAGAPINSVIAWVPQYGRIGLGVSIISYNGKVWLGIAADKGLVPDPEAIITFFHAEFDEMRSRAQKNQEARVNNLEPLFSVLDKAIQSLDELLAEARQSSPVPPQYLNGEKEPFLAVDDNSEPSQTFQMRKQAENS